METWFSVNLLLATKMQLFEAVIAAPATLFISHSVMFIEMHWWNASALCSIALKVDFVIDIWENMPETTVDFVSMNEQPFISVDGDEMMSIETSPDFETLQLSINTSVLCMSIAEPAESENVEFLTISFLHFSATKDEEKVQFLIVTLSIIELQDDVIDMHGSVDCELVIVQFSMLILSKFSDKIDPKIFKFLIVILLELSHRHEQRNSLFSKLVIVNGVLIIIFFPLKSYKFSLRTSVLPSIQSPINS